jgi:ribose 5-phosphate isomerase B
VKSLKAAKDIKVVLGADHAGFALKEKAKRYLIAEGYAVSDQGAKSLDKDDDYPDYAAKVAKIVSKDGKARGLLFCGSAEGMCIAANKFMSIRAVAVWSAASAKLTREHNDSNILCLAGGQTMKKSRGLSFNTAKSIINIWLNTEFSNEKRHIRRLDKIRKIETIQL